MVIATIGVRIKDLVEHRKIAKRMESIVVAAQVFNEKVNNNISIYKEKFE